MKSQVASDIEWEATALFKEIFSDNLSKDWLCSPWHGLPDVNIVCCDSLLDIPARRIAIGV